MEVKSNTAGDVIKYIHDDGSETTIKTTPSQEYHLGEDGEFQTSYTERHKYSIIISSSAGCNMGCKFCGINGLYDNLSAGRIIANVREALSAHPKKNLAGKYVKLCFMGMGEPFLKSINFSTIPAAIIRWIMNRGYAIGIDGVDYGTILPIERDKYVIKRINSLTSFIEDNYPTNPANKGERSIVRVFFSLHSLDPSMRKSIIPGGDPEWREILEDISAKADVIIHYTVMQWVNDTMQDCIDLHKFIWDHSQYQIRFLRYNSNGKIMEAGDYKKFWEFVAGFPNVKFQISPGKEVNSACGMFG